MNILKLSFLSKAYIKGNKNSGAIRIATCLLIIAITVISSFATVTINAMNESKEDYRSRALFLSPWKSPITDDAISEISSIEHIEHIDDATALYGVSAYNIVSTDDVYFNNEINKHNDTIINISGLYEHESKSVIAGESLENSPVYSCIVPSMFYPFEVNDGNIHYSNLNYIDGTKLIGKTITVKGFDDTICVSYNKTDGNNQCISDDTYLTSPEIKLNIVGSYYCSRANSGSFMNVFVSRETSYAIMNEAFEKSQIDISNDKTEIGKWWNTPSIHSYMVVADNYDNLSFVFNEVSALGYDISNLPEWMMKDDTILLANLFGKFGMFFICAVFIVSVITMIQSATSQLKERKGFIGLLKAIGYKNKQIFVCLSIEQLYLSLSSFLIGGVISVAIVALTNYIFKHGKYAQMIYVIDWNIFFAFMGISLVISILIPIICQLIMLRMLNKIQPKDAMG